jgi:hypothetical protein
MVRYRVDDTQAFLSLRRAAGQQQLIRVDELLIRTCTIPRS